MIVSASGRESQSGASLSGGKDHSHAGYMGEAAAQGYILRIRNSYPSQGPFSTGSPSRSPQKRERRWDKSIVARGRTISIIFAQKSAIFNGPLSNCPSHAFPSGSAIVRGLASLSAAGGDVQPCATGETFSQVPTTSRVHHAAHTCISHHFRKVGLIRVEHESRD